MSETLSLIKQLHYRKLYIQEEIEELTMQKNDVEKKIDKLLFSDSLTRPNKSLLINNNSFKSRFSIPVRISDELADFLGKEKGSMLTRPEITRGINQYIRVNNLRDNENREKFNLDAKLSSLFKLNDGDNLTYFKIQKHINQHLNK
jgi:chromatin remodeling complex protein RSC6